MNAIVLARPSLPVHRVLELRALAGHMMRDARPRPGEPQIHRMRVTRQHKAAIYLTWDTARFKPGDCPFDAATWNEVRAVLRKLGFRRVPNNGVYKDRPLLARGELRVEMEPGGFTGIALECWPTYGGDARRPERARYDSRYSDLLRPERLVFELLWSRIRVHFGALGYRDTSSADERQGFTARERLELSHASSAWPHDLPRIPLVLEGLPPFQPYNTLDGDRRHFRNGDVRYWYDDRGNLHRGRAYNDTGTYVPVIESEHQLVRVAYYDLFTWRPGMPTRRPPLGRLRELVQRAVNRERYELARLIARERDRYYPGAGQGQSDGRRR